MLQTWFGVVAPQFSGQSSKFITERQAMGYKTEQKSCINIYLLEPLDKQPVESPADSVLF